MSDRRPATRSDALLCFLLVYCAASLIHHVHNAEFLDEYPNLPAWLSRTRVYAAWLGVTTIGVVGYFLLRWRNQFIGLIVLGVYAAFGIAGLGHYAVAPMSAHTLAMNLTIWLEVAAAALVVGALACV